MQFFRYPQLLKKEDLLSMWSELIRTLTQRDEAIPQITDIFGQIVQNAEVTYDVKASDAVIVNDTTGAAIDVYLPLPSKSKQRWLIIKNLAGTANDVTINASAGSLIDGSATPYALASGDNLQLRCDGFDWWILN